MNRNRQFFLPFLNILNIVEKKYKFTGGRSVLVRNAQKMLIMTEKMCMPLPKPDRILILRYKNENNDNIYKKNLSQT